MTSSCQLSRFICRHHIKTYGRHLFPSQIGFHHGAKKNFNTLPVFSSTNLSLNQSFYQPQLRSYSKDSLGGNNYGYEEIYKNFRWEVPEHFNFSKDVIDKFAESKEDGDRTAFWYVASDGSQTKLSYKDLSSATKEAASALAGLGEIKYAMCILPKRSLKDLYHFLATVAGDVLSGRWDYSVPVLHIDKDSKVKIPEWWILNLATIRQGIILLPGTTQLQSPDIDGRLAASGADCVIADPETADKVDAVADNHAALKYKILVGGDGPREGWVSWEDLILGAGKEHEAKNTHKDDIMQIYFTSGTTGRPKMVPHTHGSYGWCHQPMAKYWLDLTPSDLHWNIADTGWAKCAWSSVFGPWSQGSTVFIHGMARFTAPDVLKTLTSYPITTLCAPPTLYRALIQEDIRGQVSKMPSLRHCVSAGEPLNEEAIYSWEEATHIVIKEGYGQTETTLLCGTFKKMNKWVKPGSMGKAAPGYDVRIVNNMGREVPRGEQGNIGVKCKPYWPPGLFKEYIGEEELTSNCFAGDYYLTGDRAIQDEDGYFWFSSRMDDLIISSGYRIGPFEVESALIKHPAVLESAVVASPDVARGQVVKAFIVLTEEFKHVLQDEDLHDNLIDEIKKHVQNNTAPYKYPRKIEFVHSLPKTVSGKIRRTELRERETNN